MSILTNTEINKSVSKTKEESNTLLLEIVEVVSLWAVVSTIIMGLTFTWV